MLQTKELKKFIWRGIDIEGFRSKGKLLAKNKQEAKNNLQAQHITVLNIKRDLTFSFFSFENKISDADITEMAMEFSTLMSAGIPLAAALKVISNSIQKLAMKTLVDDISRQIEGGKLLSEALKTNSDYFNALFSNLIYAGEQSGNLENTLKDIAVYREKIQAIQKKVKKALVYPCIVLIVAICVTCAMLIFVIPQFERLFQSVGTQLPTLTRLVIHLSEGMKNHALTLSIIPVFLYFLIKTSLRYSQTMRFLLDRLFLKIPVIGKILLFSIFSRCFSTLSALLKSGLPLLEALKITTNIAGNTLYTQGFMSVHEQLKNGETLNVALKKTQLFPIKIIQMVAIGEESGQLDFMLKKVSNYFEVKVDDGVQQLTQLLEPALMIVLCTLVGILVISMYLPIFKLGSVL